MKQVDPADIYRTFLNTKEYTFSSAAHGTCSTTDRTPGDKASLNKYKETETIPCILFDHHGLKLNFNSRNKRKPTNS